MRVSSTGWQTGESEQASLFSRIPWYRPTLKSETPNPKLDKTLEKTILRTQAEVEGYRTGLYGTGLCLTGLWEDLVSVGFVMKRSEV